VKERRGREDNKRKIGKGKEKGRGLLYGDVKRRKWEQLGRGGRRLERVKERGQDGEDRKELER
jgi:hypothetical protein